ncbi:MAG: hypothetical protein WCT27_00115 [Patescibacteria group bacterium]|jgi:hypothetical protein
MSEEEIKQLLQKNIELSEKMWLSLEKQRKIRLWTLIIGIAVIVIPLIISALAFPWMVQTIQNSYGAALNI